MSKIRKSFLMCVLTAVLISGTAWAEPILSIQPSLMNVLPGGTFSLNVNIADVSDLFAFQFDLLLEPTGILAINGSPGQGLFLGSSGMGTFFIPGTTSSGGITGIANTLLGPGPGVSGTGTLTTLSFQALIPGTASVEIANALLLDSALHNVQTTTVGGTVNVVPEPESVGAPEPAAIWVVVSGLLMLFGYAQWSRRKSPMTCLDAPLGRAGRNGSPYCSGGIKTLLVQKAQAGRAGVVSYTHAGSD